MMNIADYIIALEVHGKISSLIGCLLVVVYILKE